MVLDPKPSSTTPPPTRPNPYTVESSLTDTEDDLYTRLKTLNRQIEFIEIQEESSPKFPEVALPEDLVLGVASAIRVEINGALVTLRNIALGKDLKKFLVVIAGLWALSILGSCCNFLSLLYTSFVLLHTVPYLYDRFEDKVDAFGEKAEAEIKKQYAVFNAKVLSKIPVGALKQKFA